LKLNYPQSNVSKRVCHRLEKSLEPTIVSKDKKAFAIHSNFETKKHEYKKVDMKLKIDSMNFLKKSEENLEEMISKNRAQYSLIPDRLR